MRERSIVAGIILVILILPVAVTAADPDYLVLSTDTPWVVAGSTDTARINIQVYNQSEGPVERVPVQVWCAPSMGTITADGSETDSHGYLSAEFTPGIRSGDAVIHAAIPGTFVNTTFIQRVDHAAPSRWSLLEYSPEATVLSNVSITIRMNDSYSNVIDSRNVAENVLFIDSEGDDGGFWEGTHLVNSIMVPVGLDGNATVLYHTAGMSGDNVIQATGPSTISPRNLWMVIRGVAGEAVSIDSQVEPASGLVIANDQDTFTIVYTITDSEGNPVPSAGFLRDTSLGEHDRFFTNNKGQAMTTYGPKSSIGSVFIDATLENNPQVTIRDRVEFLHTEAMMWELTANPQVIPSRDEKEGSYASIRAKVFDIKGNPVKGEKVKFSIAATTTIPPTPSPLATPPAFLPGGTATIEALTDEDGFAVVQVQPGSFYTSGPSYDPSATAVTRIQAQWKENVKSINITFKNYPYLRVETEVTPQTVIMNQPIDVTVRLIGDGWSEGAMPVDVVLATDRSGSMALDEPDDRIVPVMAAAKSFLNEMDLGQNQDHVGLVSFGISGWANLTPTPITTQTCHAGRCTTTTTWDWSHVWGQWKNVGLDNNAECRVGGHDCGESFGYDTSSAHQQYMTTHYPGDHHYYANGATIDVPLSWNAAAIKTNIDSMLPAGYTPMRDALYKAINEIAAHGRPDVVKAVIILSDGDYNWYGDPLARGTGDWTCFPSQYEDLDTSYCAYTGLGTGAASNQNLSIYAKNNNVRIYAIGYAEDLSKGGKNTLRILAESTGGKYYDGNSANIASIYRSIAGELKTVSGINTSLNLSFETLNVAYDNITTPMPGGQVFDYIYEDGESTYIHSDNITAAGGMTPLFAYTRDDTRNWTDKRFEFMIGDIAIGQVWQANFRFMPKTPGSINIFGSESRVHFSDGVSTYQLTMPDTFVTTVANMTQETGFQALVDVKDLHAVEQESSGSAIGLLPVQWTLYYNGTGRVYQYLYYQFSRDNVVWTNSWIHLETTLTNPGPVVDANFTGTADVRDRVGYYRFRVVAIEDAPVGAYDEIESPVIDVNLQNSFIVIQ
jgi:Mg-chelatase subunit ChlD